MFLASGLIALIFVRVLAFRMWLRGDEAAGSRRCDHSKSQYRTPCSSKYAFASVPCNMATVDSNPASVQLLAATVIERGDPGAGQPVRGFKMWPYRMPSFCK
jgi:hypothetical protein